MDAVAIHLSKIAMMASPCDFCGGGAVRPDSGWKMPPHSHPFHEIVVIVSGRLLLNINGTRLAARAGDILFYRTGLVHEEQSDPKSPVESLFLSFTTSDPFPWLPLHVSDADGRIQHLVRWLIEDESIRRTTKTKKPLFELLFEELRHLSSAPFSPWLDEILAYMRERLATPLTLEDLARRGKMSKFAFIRKFKHLCGRTPMEEVRLTRLHEARTLLLTTSLPVKAIAPLVGIGDEYQLSKLFRSHFHLSPRDFRRDLRRTTEKTGSIFIPSDGHQQLQEMRLVAPPQPDSRNFNQEIAATAARQGREAARSGRPPTPPWN